MFISRMTYDNLTKGVGVVGELGTESRLVCNQVELEIKPTESLLHCWFSAHTSRILRLMDFYSDEMLKCLYIHMDFKIHYSSSCMVYIWSVQRRNVM